MATTREATPWPFEEIVETAGRMGAVAARRQTGRAEVGEPLVVALAAVDKAALNRDRFTAAQCSPADRVDDVTMLLALAIRHLTGTITAPGGDLRKALASKGSPTGYWTSNVRPRMDGLL